MQLNATQWRVHLLRGHIHYVLRLFDSAVGDFRTSLQHAALKIDGADVDDMRMLQEKLKQAEKHAAEARSLGNDYYAVLGKQCGIHVRSSAG